jgi:hypothetical protein
MGRHPVAVVILHITYARTMKVDYSRFSWGGLHGEHVVAIPSNGPQYVIFFKVEEDRRERRRESTVKSNQALSNVVVKTCDIFTCTAFK